MLIYRTTVQCTGYEGRVNNNNTTTTTTTQQRSILIKFTVSFSRKSFLIFYVLLVRLNKYIPYIYQKLGQQKLFFPDPPNLKNEL